MTETRTVEGCEWVVAVPEKRNYLAHLAPVSGEPGWATRSVKTLCGWVGFAHGTTPNELLLRGRIHDTYRRRCQRCEAKAGAETERGEANGS